MKKALALVFLTCHLFLSPSMTGPLFAAPPGAQTKSFQTMIYHRGYLPDINLFIHRVLFQEEIKPRDLYEAGTSRYQYTYDSIIPGHEGIYYFYPFLQPEINLAYGHWLQDSHIRVYSFDQTLGSRMSWPVEKPLWIADQSRTLFPFTPDLWRADFDLSELDYFDVQEDSRLLIAHQDNPFVAPYLTDRYIVSRYLFQIKPSLMEEESADPAYLSWLETQEQSTPIKITLEDPKSITTYYFVPEVAGNNAIAKTVILKEQPWICIESRKGEYSSTMLDNPAPELMGYTQLRIW
jgi:hypothetical protein